MKRAISLFIVTLSLCLSQDSRTAEVTVMVKQIQKAILHVQPRLTNSKAWAYGHAIYVAAERYGIEPETLVAIAQQESSFRDNLPEGAAGEIGICQIRKSWLHNPKFREEFGNASIKDLKNPTKSFLYAAWLLRELKKRATVGALPYWSFYNAVHFKNRFRYYVLVNRRLAHVRKAGLGKKEFDDAQSELSEGDQFWKPTPVRAQQQRIAQLENPAMNDVQQGAASQGYNEPVTLQAGSSIDPILKRLFRPTAD